MHKSVSVEHLVSEQAQNITVTDFESQTPKGRTGKWELGGGCLGWDRMGHTWIYYPFFPSTYERGCVCAIIILTNKVQVSEKMKASGLKVLWTPIITSCSSNHFINNCIEK